MQAPERGVHRVRMRTAAAPRTLPGIHRQRRLHPALRSSADGLYPSRRVIDPGGQPVGSDCDYGGYALTS
jgi:hypothetical protein